MDSLFQSFSNSVSVGSFQELSACVFSWIEEHCKPQVGGDTDASWVGRWLDGVQRQCGKKLDLFFFKQDLWRDWVTQWIFCTQKYLIPQVCARHILLINASCDPTMSKLIYFQKSCQNEKYILLSLYFLFCFSGSKKLHCSTDVFSRRWGSLWSACCGSSTASSTEGDAIVDWSPSKRTHGLVLASQGGVGNSSRPRSRPLRSHYTLTSTQLSQKDCQRNGNKPQR